MRILWNNDRFEAELTTGAQWREDMDAAKSAGFRTSGPPDWIWHTSKAAAINKLRSNKPSSGLSLTEVAVDHYKQIEEKEQQKAALKKQFKDAQKVAKKQSKDPEVSGLTDFVPMNTCSFGCLCVSASDLPVSSFSSKLLDTIVPMVYSDRCLICDDPLAPFEQTVCLWCGKEML